MLAVIRSQRGEDAIVAPLEREEADARALELARCRSVTLDQIAPIENCRRIWAENRRQFFRRTKTFPGAAEPIPAAATGSGKNEDRVSPLETEHRQSEVR
jgi:conjugative transfer region protein TrbK